MATDLVGPGVTDDALGAIGGAARPQGSSTAASSTGGAGSPTPSPTTQAAVVLGGRPWRQGLDLRLLGVFSPQRHWSTAPGAAALGHPAACLAWLANTLAIR
jgi:hypothetical protein